MFYIATACGAIQKLYPVVWVDAADTICDVVGRGTAVREPCCPKLSFSDTAIVRS